MERSTLKHRPVKKITLCRRFICLFDDRLEIVESFYKQI
jgi:hypothetical protein